jgi:peptidoglycan-N-acetylglucosamine deacetylase
VIMAGRAGAVWLTKRIAGRELVNLELHGIDLADATEDGLQALAPHQPDLRKTRAEKTDTLHAVIDTLHDQGYQFVTLAQAAHVFAHLST